MKIELLGMCAGLCTTLCFVPQVIKTLKTQCTNGISLIYFALVNIGIALWLVYGIYKHDMPIILANAFSLIFAIIILFVKSKNVILRLETI